MPPKPLIDLAKLDPDNVVIDIEGIRARIPQRFEMEMLDAIIYQDYDNGHIAAIKTLRDDQFWCRGHFPGRPVLPGVLIIETAGQLCSFFFSSKANSSQTLGFAATDKVKFRGLVQPGDTLIMMSELTDYRTRRATFDTQAYVDGRMVFEGSITGMLI